MPVSAEQRAEGWVSVTEVLVTFMRKGLLAWYLKTGAKEAKRLSTIALKIGSRVDALIQEDVTNGSYKLTAKDPIEVRNCMEGWESFKKDYGLHVEACQVEVKDEESKVIGHIDLIGWNRVIDVKCASSIKPNYWLQTSKYSSMKFKSPVMPAILRLDKNLGTYQFMDAMQAKVSVIESIKVFDGLLTAYRYYNQPKGQEVINESGNNASNGSN